MKQSKEVTERVIYVNKDNKEQVKKEAAQKTQAIIEMMSNGMHPKKVAESVGCTEQFVWNLAKALNLVPSVRTPNVGSLREVTSNGILFGLGTLKKIDAKQGDKYKIVEMTSSVIKIEFIKD